MMKRTLDRALEAVAADALYAAATLDDLQDAWSAHCDEFEDKTPERARLYQLYLDRLAILRSAERMGGCLRAG